jgi:glutaryl-CoA dehydrogenase
MFGIQRTAAAKLMGRAAAARLAAGPSSRTLASSRRLFSTLKHDDDDNDNDENHHVNAFGGPGYDWKDPFRFRDQLTEEEVAVWDAARSFCQGELQPIILEANRHEKTLDHDLMKKMGEVGLLGATIPVEYGGVGLGYVSYGLLATEVERVDSSYRSAMSVQSSLVMYPIYAYGTEEMKRKYLPELASGNLVGCFGLTVCMIEGENTECWTNLRPCRC